MPRTFSLGRLLLVITLFCLICGALVNFPRHVFAAFVIAILFSPTIFIWLTLAFYSHHQLLTTLACLAGSVWGICLATRSYVAVIFAFYANLAAREYLLDALLAFAIPAFGTFF